ncbi:Nsg1p KNAG_0H03690 [Huiozyma naganishii CBS 8797]|uniref:Uncharacterized protein n=1 Tax=Huiozyma naganishii (strain ATCC MYA-139 / BCRC 22969 / CBS 8797 / KCTC 17520 / NBRC 10181 / NCYC 3082 / Yp74L-3) TaxID=1071383 RepID=J7RPV3_HUIN7|nr:hypothetical protein KNAG_0H03690 [Kazachstania naganishii CBS 8797]CCK71783.1 hypothetical protein KNAG_0H03690 [Kazachstania naganishii CBS 8797]
MSKGIIKKEDSVFNLTKPALYSIYDTDVTRSEQDYRLLHERPVHLGSGRVRHKRKMHEVLLNGVIAVTLLFWTGVLFAKLSAELYDNRSLKKWMLSYTLDHISKWVNTYVVSVPAFAVYGVLGVLCGVSVPLLDEYVFQHRLDDGVDFKSVLKCLNALLGVCFGIRTIQWSSSMQGAGAWCLLNVLLWVFFDGTWSILTMGTAVVLVSVVMGRGASSSLSYLLYIVDFYSFSFMIFGKLGRYLFN